MTAATFLVGDVRERMAELPDGHFDFILCSPPFLALRSYLPEGHPDKALEIGSEATPAAYLDVLLELTAEWGRLLAPHGSIAIELGDTYAGSGGAGGDYQPDGLRDGQPRFRQNNLYGAGSADGTFHGGAKEVAGSIPLNAGPGWPLDKSLTCIPQLYQVALAYGLNPLTGRESPAGRWRVRNLKAWIRSNPPVGALGNKERPATSYIIVATQSPSRWFDLDAVRTPVSDAEWAKAGQSSGESWFGPGHPVHVEREAARGQEGYRKNRVRRPDPGGAPPLDWYHPIDATINAVLDDRNGQGRKADTSSVKVAHGKPGQDGNWDTLGHYDGKTATTGARGVHIRRALETAGYLTPQDFYDISPKGYSGAHYAVWPPELCRQLIDEMCPRQVCTTCGLPSRRLTEVTYGHDTSHANGRFDGEKYADKAEGGAAGGPQGMAHGRATKHVNTVGWSDCGHNTWRPGRILDPFVGSGTTLAVATGMARTAVGIDLDERNADLARQRCGMFLEVHP